ncbi:plasmid mobilization relaxosome protein MobC [Bartonella sp. LJL80]
MASKKDAGFYLLLSKAEKALFQKTAQSYNINVSHMIRRLVLAAEAEAQLVEPELSETIGDLCRQLHAIGVNLNLLTRAVTQGYLPAEQEFVSILEQIHAGCLALAETYGEMIIHTRSKVDGALRNE